MRPETRDRHACSDCGKRFVVVYYRIDADEPTRTVSVACPHCGAANRVDVGSAAAGAGEFWAERLTS